MENKGANYAGLNDDLRRRWDDAKNQKEKEDIVAEFLEKTRRTDAVANPTEMVKTISKQTEVNKQMEAIKQNYERLADSDVKCKGKMYQ